MLAVDLLRERLHVELDERSLPVCEGGDLPGKPQCSRSNARRAGKYETPHPARNCAALHVVGSGEYLPDRVSTFAPRKGNLLVRS